MTVKDITGKRFGRLTVIGISRHTRSGFYWICKCDCGNLIEAVVHHLNNGHIKSCKCLNNEVCKNTFTKHGMYNTAEYRTWIGMKMRCYNINGMSFHNYGGRGIKVCKRWHKFENFFSDMGKKPTPKHSIERIDNNKGYSPDNCKWATTTEQLNNTRHNSVIEINGVRKNRIQWLKEYNLNQGTYGARIRRGWSYRDAITKSSKTYHHAHHPASPEEYVISNTSPA